MDAPLIQMQRRTRRTAAYSDTHSPPSNSRTVQRPFRVTLCEASQRLLH
jgi:hypothetical protein